MDNPHRISSHHPLHDNSKGLGADQMRRKAIAIQMNTLVLIMLLLVAFVFISIVFGKWVVNADSKGAESKCKFSILAASRAKVMGQTLISIDCPRREHVITFRDIESKGVADDDKVKKEIAEQLVRCWDMVGRGELQGFDQYLIGDFGKDKDMACLICTSIEFDKKIQDSYRSNPEIGGFEYYLNNYPLDASMKYSQLISKAKEIEVWVVPFIYRAETVGDPVIMDSFAVTKKDQVVYVAFPGSSTNFISEYLKKSFSDVIKKNEPYSMLVMATDDGLTGINCRRGLFN